MKEIKINIADKDYIVKLAETEDQKGTGLQGVSELKDSEGMLFVFDESQEISFWMKDTQIPLDIIFIDEELNVKSIHEGIPESETLVTEDDVVYVLEVNSDSGIKEGDELKFKPDATVSKEKMQVLNENGESQMELNGGERIFSRKDTKILIKFAKKAHSTNRDSDYKALGKRVFKFLQTQEENEPEYVESKN